MPGLSDDPDKRQRQLAGLRAGQRKQALARLGLSEADVAHLPQQPAGAGETVPAIPGQLALADAGPAPAVPASSSTPAAPAHSSPAGARGSSSAPRTIAGLPVLDPGAHLPPAPPAPAAPQEATADVIPADPQPERRRGALGQFLDGLAGGV